MEFTFLSGLLLLIFVFPLFTIQWIRKFFFPNLVGDARSTITWGNDFIFWFFFPICSILISKGIGSKNDYLIATGNMISGLFFVSIVSIFYHYNKIKNY